MTSIEWTEKSWNPTRGCTKVSPGCKNCYADEFAKRFEGVVGHPYELGFAPRTVPEALDKPLRRRAPTMYFVNSMSDLFLPAFPVEYVAAVFGVMAAARRHTFQVLTKHPERAAEFFDWIAGAGSRGYVWQSLYEYAKAAGVELPPEAMDSPWPWPLLNVWIGTSVEDKKRKARIDALRKVPARVRFLSCEPLLEDLGYLDLSGIGWVIAGGESGRKARPCNIDWIRNIMAQCRDPHVPVFVKQLGKQPFETAKPLGPGAPGKMGVAREITVTKKGGDPKQWPGDLRVREWPRSA